MNTAQLLATLTHQGFTLRPLPGEKIEVRPAGRLTPELREELRQKKAEVLALLTSEPLPSADPPDQDPTPGATLDPVIFWTDSRKIDPANPPVPYLNSRQELVIPFDCDPKYHYWKPGGQSLAQTLAELDAPPEVWRRYVMGYTETKQ